MAIGNGSLDFSLFGNSGFYIGPTQRKLTTVLDTSIFQKESAALSVFFFMLVGAMTCRAEP